MTYHPPHITRLGTRVPGAPAADLTVAPKTVHDVASVLHHASDKGLNVQVWGGGTRSGFGAPPPPDIVMSMERFDAIEVWEPDDLTLVAGAGCRVTEIEQTLATRNQTAVLPEHAGDSTLGGVIASGASSLRRGRLFGIRERVLEVTVVTGDGRIIRAGGRVVKNVTGYDFGRLCVGAFGALGVIVEVCLKLWPTPPASATITLKKRSNPSAVGRPLALLEEPGSRRLFIWGTDAEVSALAKRVAGQVEPGLDWPADPHGRFRWSLRVPPAATVDALVRLPPGWNYLAIHGVGEVRAASEALDGARELRSWAESVGGALVSTASPAGGLEDLDPWGTPPPALQVQHDLIAHFDPARVINPGRLPGGL